MSIETATRSSAEPSTIAPRSVQIHPMTAADAGEVLTLQRAAYVIEAQGAGDPFLPALTQTLDELIHEIVSGGGFVLRLNERLVGAIRTRTVRGELHIGRLTVAPDMQGRGFGGALLFAAANEAAATDIPNTADDDVAVMHTGRLSEVDVGLYVRRGYVETHREPLRPGVSLVHMRKSAAAVSL